MQRINVVPPLTMPAGAGDLEFTIGVETLASNLDQMLRWSSDESLMPMLDHVEKNHEVYEDEEVKNVVMFAIDILFAHHVRAERDRRLHATLTKGGTNTK